MTIYYKDKEELGREHDSRVDSLYILISVINKIDAEDASKSLMLTQLDVEQLAIYKLAINRPYAQ